MSMLSVGRVLIIDDDVDTRVRETAYMARAGWVVDEAGDCPEGVALARKFRPDVIVCARCSPGIDGLAIIGELAADPVTAAVPVLLVAEMADVEDVVRGFEAGAHDYLVRAIDLAEFEVRCRAALQVSREHRRLVESDLEGRLLANNVTELVMRCGLDGTIRYVSPSATKLLGRRPEDLVGRAASELCHPDDLAAMSAAAGAIVGDIVSTTRRLRCADGTYLWLELTGQVVLGLAGEPELLTAGRDISHRLAADAALVDSQAAYRQIVELAAEGIWVTDSEQRTTFANPRMAEMLAVPAGQLLGRSVQEFMDDEGRALSVERVERRKAGLGDTGDFKFVRDDGTELWTSINAAPIVDHDGSFLGSLALVADVTDRHRQDMALARSEARYRVLLDHLPDTLAIVYDSQLQAVIVAGGGLASRGLDGAAMIGRHFRNLVTAEDAATLGPIYESALGGVRTTTEFLSEVTGTDDLIDVVPIPSPDGCPTSEILVVARDIGTIKQRERVLAAAEQEWRATFDNGPVGMAQVGVDGRFLRVNSALCDMLGYSAEQLEAFGPVEITHSDDAARVRQELAQLAGGEVTRFRDERRYIHALGRVVWAAVSAIAVSDEHDQVHHLLVHYFEITAQKVAEAELQHIAVHDQLTGLLNRRGFDAELSRHLAHINRYGQIGAMLVLDLDGLKAINDNHGHEAGDRVITSVGSALRSRLRTTDTIARLGGDEFAVILPRADRAEAEVVAASIVEVVRGGRVCLAGASLSISTSVGVAMFADPGQSAQEIIAEADKSMYEAKAAGGSRYAFPSSPGG